MAVKLERLKVRRTIYRALQLFEHIMPFTTNEVDEALRELLPGDQLALVMRLTAADRRHHLDVHRRLIDDGHSDQDLLRAALLHDVGKAMQRTRVWTVHRVLKVLLSRFAPSVLHENSQPEGNWLQRGLFLALEHPRLGAELVRVTGASERTCWLIEHHHDGTIHGDAELDELRAADERG